MTTKIDSIILGHNPFFGIDHLSAQRGNEKSQRFEDVGKIIEVLKHSHSLGARGMMMSTHPRAQSVSKAILEDSVLSSSWRVYPLVPYIQKYVRGSNEKGLGNLLVETLSQATLGQKLGLLLRGGKGLITKDLKQLVELLVDIEMLPFQKLNLGAIFLHDVVTDLVFNLGLDNAFEYFRDHVQKKYGVPAAFVTKNLPAIHRKFKANGWLDSPIMASLNSVGFYVNPSIEACQEALFDPNLNFVAMNSLASGHLSPDDAYKFLARYPALRSVVVGVSRKESATQTIGAMSRHLKFELPPQEKL
ncbi:MAG: hypothetical protein IT289_07585 [Oligoflexia bacterium]|nr:hypothetical protein [Oligoflexia bacterium]